MSVFLGVDGGGTKTSLCLLSDGGQVVATSRGPSMYRPSEPAEVVRSVLERGLRALLRRADLRADDLTYAFFGIPTYGESSLQRGALDAAPAAVLGHHRYRCGNDMICGWAGSLGLNDGINVVSGTGSIAYGERDGVGARAGGWGPLIGDEGSAYWVGCQALGAAARMIDLRESRDPLGKVLLDHLGAVTELDLVHAVTVDWNSDRTKVASLAILVDQLAESGSQAATRILRSAATELARLLRVLHSRLGFSSNTPVPVSWSGGLFESNSMRGAFARDLEAGAERFDLQAPLFSPAVGAALYAARAAGQTIHDEAIRTLSRDPARQVAR